MPDLSEYHDLGIDHDAVHVVDSKLTTSETYAPTLRGSSPVESSASASTKPEKTDDNSDAPDESNLPTDIRTFEEAVLKNAQIPRDISKFAATVAESTEFQSLVDDYSRVIRPIREDYIDKADEWSDWEGSSRRRDKAISIFDGIVTIARSVNPEIPKYANDIEYRRRERKTNPQELSEYVGALRESTLTGDLPWHQVLFTFDFRRPHIPPPTTLLPSSSPSGAPLRDSKRKLSESEEGVLNSSKRPRHASPSRIASAPSSSPFPMPTIPGEVSCGALDMYAAKVFDTLGNRRHHFGIVLSGLELRFWYFDRAGKIYSTPVHLLRDKVQIARMFIAFSYCDMTFFGLEPCIESPNPVHTVPTSLVGHQCIINEHSFTIDRPLHISSGIFGRGTTVFAARLSGRDSEAVVVKLSWQAVSHKPEDELYRIAEQCGVQGVARLYHSCVASTLSAGLRSQLVPDGGYKDRELRMHVTGPMGMRLSEVKDVEVFTKAFRSLVKAHHDLYELAGILHRDISPYNLMVLASDPSIGLLVDLDHAVRIKDGDKMLDVKPAITGTKPFLALDLLRDDPVEPYYHHDLESFFYTLAWILNDEDNPDVEHAFQEWCHGTWSNIKYNKIGFIDLIDTRERHPLQEGWLVPLGEVFLENHPELRDDDCEGDPNRQISYDMFMNCLV